jgi:hypothetical protein
MKGEIKKGRKTEEEDRGGQGPIMGRSTTERKTYWTYNRHVTKSAISRYNKKVQILI